MCGAPGDRGPRDEVGGAQGQGPGLKGVSKNEFETGSRAAGHGYGSHQVQCCGMVHNDDVITEAEYVRGIKTSARNYVTAAGEQDHQIHTAKHREHHVHRGDVLQPRRVRFLDQGNDQEGRLRDDNGPPRLARFGDDTHDWGDYSFSNCRKIVGDLVFGRGKLAMRSVRYIDGDEANHDCVTYGLFTHGGVHGLTRATKDEDALVRFLNYFARHHLGEDATWTSISLTKNIAIDVHRDSNNLRGSLNHCVTFGQEDGGGLWLEVDVDEAQAQGKDISWKRDRSGWIPGRFYNNKDIFVSFDPFKKHCSAPWAGTRWCLTYHTVRGITEVGSEIKKFLKGAGFPIAYHKHYKSQAAGAALPRKSVRNNIMNAAGKIGVLMTTLLVATGTYLNEVCGPPAEYDPIVMMELGGLEGTEEAVNLGKAVIEPLMWTDLLDNDTQENAYHFVTGASPRELRVHLDEMPKCLEALANDLVKEQIQRPREGTDPWWWRSGVTRTERDRVRGRLRRVPEVQVPPTTTTSGLSSESLPEELEQSVKGPDNMKCV